MLMEQSGKRLQKFCEKGSEAKALVWLFGKEGGLSEAEGKPHTTSAPIMARKRTGSEQKSNQATHEFRSRVTNFYKDRVPEQHSELGA